MKCGSCNAENPASAKFCHACGVPLAMQQAQTPPPGAQPKSAGTQISPTVIGIVLLLGISVVGAGYVGFTWYEDSSRQSGPVSTVDEKTIEERRKKAEQDRQADERQKTADAEREKQRQQADAQEAMKLAQGKADEDRRRAEDAARDAQEKANRAEGKAREDARAAQEAKARQEAQAQQESKAVQDARAQEAKAREAKAREEARAKELARREAAAREAKARQQAQATTAAARPAETAAPAPAPAPAQPQPQPVPVAQAAPAQNDPCAAFTGLKREQCASCNRHTFGPRKAACEDRAMERYCERRWNQPGQQDCVDSRRR